MIYLVRSMEKKNRISYYPSMKRFMDIFLSSFALLCFFPFMLTISILIKLDSKGPVFFIHKRIGRDMEPFSLIKFRTMTTRPEKKAKEFDPGDSSRITKLGRILRKTKFDEIPELINILKGDMSIIGPRPEVESYVKIFQDDFKKILKIRPGLSDKASVKYRDEEKILALANDPAGYYLETILPDKIRLAKEYAAEITFLQDISIIMDTIKSLFNFNSYSTSHD